MRTPVLFGLAAAAIVSGVTGCHARSVPPSPSTTRPMPGQNDVASDGFAPGALGRNVPVVRRGDLDRYVGQVVAVRGVVGQQKIPHLEGVQIYCAHELRGRDVYAVGVLGRFEIAPDDPVLEQTQNDGPGVKYLLYFDLSGKPAEARLVRPPADQDASPAQHEQGVKP